jgi:hypothetical protein
VKIDVLLLPEPLKGKSDRKLLSGGEVLRKMFPLSLPERDQSPALQPGSIDPGTALSSLKYRGLFRC